MANEWEKLRMLVTLNMEHVRQTGQKLKDVEQHVFEAAMEVVYGAEVWKVYNKLLK